MKIVVTGGSGQLGSLILERCARHKGVDRITVLDKVPPTVPSPKIRFIEADVRDPAIGPHFEGHDALVHLAFLIFSHSDPALFDAVNVGGSENVFTLAAEAGLTHMLYASSVAAYGVVPGHPVPITEDAPRKRDPHLHYAANKYDVESFLDAFEVAHPEVTVTRLRPAVLVGRRMEHFLGRMLRKRLLLDFQGPPLPLVWDEDVADAFMLALDRKAHGAFNVGSDDPISNRELAAANGLRLIAMPSAAATVLVPPLSLLRRVGLSAPIDPNWLLAGRNPVLPANDKARAELGWRPKCRTAQEVVAQFVRVASRRPNRRIALFFRVAGLLDRVSRSQPERLPTQLRIHLDLIGADGGDYALLVERGRIRCSAGIPRPNDAVLRIRSRDFQRLLSGELTWEHAELTGRIRLLGAPEAKLVVSNLIDSFRARQQGAGAGAFAARRISRWLVAGSRA